MTSYETIYNRFLQNVFFLYFRILINSSLPEVQNKPGDVRIRGKQQEPILQHGYDRSCCISK